MNRVREITTGQSRSRLWTVRAWIMNRVREITTGQISSPDRHAVRWVLLVLILSDVPHWKIVGRQIVYGEVALSIVVPGSRSSLRELTSAALPFNLRRCTTAWHVPS